MNNLDYVLGLDLGVASVGWAVMEIDSDKNPVRLVDANSVIFKALDNDKGKLYNEERRDARGARRVLNRRKERIRRVKELLISSKFLSESELYNLYEGKLIDIFDVRKKGLTEQLNKLEIARLMIYYLKNRGFKSNRKTDDIELEEELKKLTKNNNKNQKNNGENQENSEESKKNNEKKLKPIIALNTKRLQEDNLMPIELIFKIKEEKNVTGFKNKEGLYIFGFKREQIEKEAQQILEKQKLISTELLEKYMDILKSQRDFSEGPALPSKYRIDWESKTGRCKYTGEKRVVAGAPSYEIFCMLQKLTDLRYIYIENDTKNGKYKLSSEQLNVIYNKVINEHKKLTYNLILSCIEDKNVRILNLPKLKLKDYIDITKKYLEKKQKKEEELTDEEKHELNYERNNKRNNEQLFELKHFNELIKQFKKNNISEDDIEKIGGFDFLDKIAELLTYAKTDKKLDEYYQKDRYKDIPKDVIEKIKTFKTFNQTGNLSLSLIKKLNAKMLEGNDYEKSLSSLGYSLVTDNNWEKFPTVLQIEKKFNTKITNPNVKHIMVILRKLYNTLLEKYGKPKKVHIELARDIANDFSTRNKIKQEQEKNRINREVKSLEIYSQNLDIFNHKDNISNEDYLRYRLYDEQNGICIYSGKKIEKSQLLTSEYQVDHILPYSKSGDNSYNNKVLVFAKENQDKKNKTPYQWLKNTEKWFQFKKRVELNTKIKDKKKNNLLYTDNVEKNEFLERDLHATSYSSKLALQIFKSLIPTDEKDMYDEKGEKKEIYIYNRNVIAFNGSMTSQLRKFYGLNRFTHSFESENLKLEKNYKFNELLCTENKLELTAKNEKTGDIIKKEYKVEKDKNTKDFKTEKDRIISNETLQMKNISKISEKLKNKYIENLKEKDFVGMIEFSSMELISTVFELCSQIKQEINLKNRSNHLHHALDATLLTIMNHSMQQRLTKFNQVLQQMSNSPKEYLNEETGEIMTYKELLEKMREDTETKSVDLYNNKTVQHYKIPGTNETFSLSLPYINFIEEIKNIIFIKNENSEEAKLPYHVIKSKTKGKLHSETILGESKGQVTKRVSVLKLYDKKWSKKKNIEEILKNLFDKEKSQKEIYETLKKWLSEKTKEYPKLKNGHIIKKVKMIDENKDKLIKLGNKRYVEMGQTIVKILVLRNKNKDGYRMASLGRYNHINIKNGKDFKLQIWQAADNLENIVEYSKLKNDYDKITELFPGEVIELEIKDGNKIICLVNGFTEGKLSVETILGDYTDVVRNKVFKTISSSKQYPKTISQIKNIKKLKYNILGDKICPLDKF
ncbi:type II CRISPR RNA-guided endonuclease Cas9 [Caviibacter abscessus]|uniref:type II CRISPR RNA-guided endonuclease Cas9 n=1 Tax=Caviibacter abscessus TaxID=1766719 RepID=UPI000839B005|nr:type II CRISPR RNA-guided endonuclease Cas9 [Caviibacter abscessus]